MLSDKEIIEKLKNVKEYISYWADDGHQKHEDKLETVINEIERRLRSNNVKT